MRNFVKASDRVQLYPFLQEFFQNSPTFNHYWMGSTTTPRLGLQCAWRNISDNSCLMAQAFYYLLKNEEKFFFQRCPHVEDTTYQRLKEVAQEIEGDPDSLKLFYLMIYARDFGWVDTQKGQGHQQAGVPVMEKILNELKFRSQIVELGKIWIANHSVPAETFNGEVSPNTIKTLLGIFSEEQHLKMVQMFVM